MNEIWLKQAKLWKLNSRGGSWPCLDDLTFWLGSTDSPANQRTLGWPRYCHQTCSALHGWDCVPALLPWLPSCLPLWRLLFLLEKNTITSWFGRSTMKEKIPFIHILAVFYWYAGQSVLNKTEVNLQFQRNRDNSLFQYRVVRRTYPTSPKTSETGVHSARGKMGSAMGKKKTGK